jgi:hypothetical protein
MDEDNLFEVKTPLGFTVYVKKKTWEIIVTIKHPVMAGQEREVERVLGEPEEIRSSRRGEEIYLFYRQVREKRWTCAVVKRTNGEGFLITAYPTDKIKEGETIWSR